MLEVHGSVQDPDQPGWFRGALTEHAPLPRSLSMRKDARRKHARTPYFWREKDEVIYLLTWSDGTSGPVWARRLRQGGHWVMPEAQQFLRSAAFQPTCDVVRTIAIVKRRHIVGRRTVSEVHATFHTHQLTLTHPEVACLLRTQLTAKHLEAMGLSRIFVAHAPAPERNGQLVVGSGNLDMHEMHDSIDHGATALGIAFVVCEQMSPLLLAVS